MTMDASQIPTLAGGGALVALLVVLLVARRVRARRRVATSEAPVAEAAPGVPTEEDLEAVAPGADDETVAVRALRAQVRTLEQALEEVQQVEAPVDVPVDAPVDAPVELAVEIEPAPVVASAGPEGSAYRRQVRLAVRAVEQRTSAGADPRETAARVRAAIDRLDAEPGFARPVLPVLLGVTAPAVSAPVAPAPVAGPRPAVPDPEVTGPEVTGPEMTGPEASGPEASGPEDEIVLPVPPPAPAEPHRGRRRPRRRVAA